MSAPRPASTPTLSGRGLFRPALLLLALPLVPALLTGWLHPRRPDWAALRAEARAPAPGQLDLSQILATYPDALWIDARSAADFAAEHVPDALSLNEDDWERGFAAVVEQWDGRRAIVVYCGGETCHASEAVARRLRRELGVDGIYVLRDGWTAWRAAQTTKGAQ